jgi:hypothetical protein
MSPPHSLRSRASAISALALICMALAPVPAAATDPQPPTPQEQQIFQQKLARLKSHSNLYPANGGIASVLNSLDHMVTIPLICGTGDPVTRVEVRVNTTLKKWDAALVKARLGSEGKVGAYLWNYEVTVVDGVKIITCDNWIMLDPAVSGPQEGNPPIGPIADETLLYHELLHGQLLLDSVMTSAAWKQNVCACNAPDLASSDPDHAVIAGLEEAFMTALAGGTSAVRMVRPPAQPADGDGKFSIDLGAIEKENLTVTPYYPDGSNVDPADVTVELPENGHVIVKGKLTDKTKRGYILVHVDPPTLYVVAGIEQAIVILPTSVAPGLDGWRLGLLAALILASALVVVRRRERRG